MEFMKRVETLRPKLRAIAHRLDGRYTAFNDDDLYQEALLSLWKKHQAGELDDKTDSFVLQGGYFTMKNFIRSNHRRVDQMSVSLEAPLNENGDSWRELLAQPEGRRADEIVDRNTLAAALRERLSEREAVVLEMYGQGMTTREIGRRLNISHVMVVKVEKRIKEKCRQLRPGAEEYS